VAAAPCVRHHGKLAILSGIQQAGAIIVLVPLNSFRAGLGSGIESSLGGVG